MKEMIQMKEKARTRMPESFTSSPPSWVFRGRIKLCESLGAFHEQLPFWLRDKFSVGLERDFFKQSNDYVALLYRNNWGFMHSGFRALPLEIKQVVSQSIFPKGAYLLILCNFRSRCRSSEGEDFFLPSARAKRFWLIVCLGRNQVPKQELPRDRMRTVQLLESNNTLRWWDLLRAVRH